MKRQGLGTRDQGHGSHGRWRQLIGPFVILLAAAAAVAPQLLSGASCGHDFDFHLVSWFDALNAWRHGIPYPHWTPSANYGAGEPRFVFYSPLTWMLGAALGSVLPWTLVPAALTFLILAGTGLATRALAREALDKTAATLAGCVALFSGYALFTAYERSAFAELAGGCWIPLVLLYALPRLRQKAVSGDPSLLKTDELSIRPINTTLSINTNLRINTGLPCPILAPFFWRKGGKPQLCSRAESIGIAALALAIAGAWLSNPTVGVMACYLLAAVALVRIAIERAAWPAVRAAAGAVLGMALVAVYLVPAAWEQRWVDIHQVTQDPGQTLENNWLFAVHADPSMAYHDEVLHTVSTIAVVMVALALGGLLVCWRRGCLPGERSWWAPLALVPLAVLALQFPFSRPLWNLLPELRFLQFPWRWLVVLEAPMAIFVVAAVWPGKSARNSRRIAIGSVFALIFLAMTAHAAGTLYQPCDDEDAAAPMLDVYRSGAGFIGTFEYEPIGADNELVATGLPQACLTGNAFTVLGSGSADPDAPPAWSASQGSCEATYAAASGSGPEHLRIHAEIPHPGYLILRLRSYPAWAVKVNGRAAASLPRRRDGLLAVPVPQGPVDLTVDWTTTADAVAARWLSALGVLALTGLGLLAKRQRRARLS